MLLIDKLLIFLGKRITCSDSFRPFSSNKCKTFNFRLEVISLIRQTEILNALFMADRKRITYFFSLDFIKVRRLELHVQVFVKFSVYSKPSNLLVLYLLKNLVPMISGLSLPFTREKSWERHCPNVLWTNVPFRKWALTLGAWLFIRGNFRFQNCTPGLKTSEQTV